jgi:hypothetical protein
MDTEDLNSLLIRQDLLLDAITRAGGRWSTNKTITCPFCSSTAVRCFIARDRRYIASCPICGTMDAVDIRGRFQSTTREETIALWAYPWTQKAA